MSLQEPELLHLTLQPCSVWPSGPVPSCPGFSGESSGAPGPRPSSPPGKRPAQLLFSRVDLWNASNLKFGDEFLGELRVPLKVLRQSSPHEAW